jgi:hypothetical protein
MVFLDVTLCGPVYFKSIGYKLTNKVLDILHCLKCILYADFSGLEYTPIFRRLLVIILVNSLIFFLFLMLVSKYGIETGTFEY